LIEYHPSCIAVASIMCSFGGSEAHVEGWIEFIKEHNILNTDFVRIFLPLQYLNSFCRIK